MVTVGTGNFEQLLEKARQYLLPEKLAALEDAYRFAAEAHEGQTRRSGEPFLEHPLQTALILAGLQLDASSLIAALLHDIPEDCGRAKIDKGKSVPASILGKRFRILIFPFLFQQ